MSSYVIPDDTKLPSQIANQLFARLRGKLENKACFVYISFLVSPMWNYTNVFCWLLVVAVVIVIVLEMF